MVIAKWWDLWNNQKSRCLAAYSSIPAWSSSDPTADIVPLIYNNDPNVYIVTSPNNVKVYNSAIYKDTVNNRWFATIVTLNNSGYHVTTLESWTSWSSTGRLDTYYSDGICQTESGSVGDNFAYFETDLPIFTNVTDYNNYITNLQNPPIQTYTSNGGGATHIAKITGQLKDLSSNLSDILIISGGGGGGMIVNDKVYEGADAGGIAGNSTNSANQTTGYAFGQGEDG